MKGEKGQPLFGTSRILERAKPFEYENTQKYRGTVGNVDGLGHKRSHRPFRRKSGGKRK